MKVRANWTAERWGLDTRQDMTYPRVKKLGRSLPGILPSRSDLRRQPRTKSAIVSCLTTSNRYHGLKHTMMGGSNAVRDLGSIGCRAVWSELWSNLRVQSESGIIRLPRLSSRCRFAWCWWCYFQYESCQPSVLRSLRKTTKIALVRQ